MNKGISRIIYCQERRNPDNWLINLDVGLFGKEHLLEITTSIFNIPLIDINHTSNLYDSCTKTKIDIEKDKVNKIIELVENVQITLAPKTLSGLDGWSSYLSIKSGFHLVTFRWWVSLPEEWEPLKPIALTLAQWANVTPRFG